MSKTLLAGSIAVLLWIAWCVLVVEEVVPQLRRHLLIWDWLMAYVLCLAPVLVLAIIVVMRVRQRS